MAGAGAGAYSEAEEDFMKKFKRLTIKIMFEFTEALLHLKNGSRIERKGWNGKGMFIALQTPDEGSKMTLPYIYISTVDGKLVPWLASQTDLLADDWSEGLGKSE